MGPSTLRSTRRGSQGYLPPSPAASPTTWPGAAQPRESHFCAALLPHATPSLACSTTMACSRFLFARWLCKPRGAVSKSCIGVPIVTTAVALLRNPDIPPATAPRPIPCAAGLLPMNSASQSPLAPLFPPHLPPRPRAGHTSARASRTSPCMTSCVTSLCWTKSTQNTASRSAWVARWVYSWAWFLLGARTS